MSLVIKYAPKLLNAREIALIRARGESDFAQRITQCRECGEAIMVGETRFFGQYGFRNGKTAYLHIECPQKRRKGGVR